MFKKIFIGLLFIIAITLFFVFDFQTYLTLESLQEQRGNLQQYYEENTVQTLIIYFVVYVIVTAASLPGAIILTLGAGALFGLWNGLLLVSFASTVGACCAFFSSRTLFGEYLQNKYATTLKKINEGLKKDGPFYLLTLRLVPLIPFFLINLVMGLTRMPLGIFYLYSQIGMLPGTFVYVNAGTALSSIKSVQDIASFQVLASFALLGIVPIVIKMILKLIKKRKKVQ